MDMTTNNIQGTAILVSLSIRKWLARKFDQVASRQVNDVHGSRDAARVSKKLIAAKDAATDERNEYGILMGILTEARGDHYLNTLAWGNEGKRLLTVGNMDEYIRLQRRHLVAFAQAKPLLVRAYPTLLADAPDQLGTLFRASDYPGADEIGDRFSIFYSREPLPIVGESIVDELAAPQVAAVRAEYNATVGQQIEDALAAAMDDARARVAKVVGEIAGTMSKKKGEPGYGFKNSKLSNARKLVNTMRRLNATDDTEFSGLLDRIDGALAGVDPQVLREDKTERAAMAKTADEILADMSIFGGAK